MAKIIFSFLILFLGLCPSLSQADQLLTNVNISANANIRGPVTGEYVFLEQLVGTTTVTTTANLSQNNSSRLIRGSADVGTNPLTPFIQGFAWVENNKTDLATKSFDEVVFQDTNLASFATKAAEIFSSQTGGGGRTVNAFAPSDQEEEVTWHVVEK